MDWFLVLALLIVSLFVVAWIVEARTSDDGLAKSAAEESARKLKKELRTVTFVERHTLLGPDWAAYYSLHLAKRSRGIVGLAAIASNIGKGAAVISFEVKVVDSSGLTCGLLIGKSSRLPPGGEEVVAITGRLPRPTRGTLTLAYSGRRVPA